MRAARSIAVLGCLGAWVFSLGCLHLGPREWTPTENQKAIMELTIAWQGGARIKKLPKGDYVWSYVEPGNGRVGLPAVLLRGREMNFGAGIVRGENPQRCLNLSRAVSVQTGHFRGDL